MKKLQLSLKNKWFDMTKAGVKTEDYRDVTTYWASRLYLVNGIKKPVEWWRQEYFEIDGRFCDINEIAENLSWFCEPIDFTHNIMTLGYPKSGDTDRKLTYEHAGIEIRQGNPDWGAEKGKIYFVIKHGKRIDL